MTMPGPRIPVGDTLEAIINYLTARTDFYLMEGSLLQRRGIGNAI